LETGEIWKVATMTLTDIIAPLTPATALYQVTDTELAMYAKLIYGKTGIQISPQKQTLLSNRLRRRLRVTGIKSFKDYYQHLKQLPSCDPEWDAFLQEITTHETYLFRDEAQWAWFQQVFLPEHIKSAKSEAGQRSLRIWSAACSTGDEAYSVACCIANHQATFRQWKITILATDIGLGAIKQGKNGLFSERAMHLVPDKFRQSYFTEIKAGQTWQAKPILTEMISFRQHNLMEPLREKQFDLVFLKNVLIYFDSASKMQVLANVLPLCKSGGMLVVSASEGVSDLLKNYVRIQPWLFINSQK
jgi:chemotaxis protein methyltransferase CheR